MLYKLEPLQNNIVVEPIKPKDVKNYTGKTLSDVETMGMDVLQYGKVIRVHAPDKDHHCTFSADDIVLYEKLASHKTNIGDPRQVLVNIEHVQGQLMEIKDAN